MHAVVACHCSVLENTYFTFFSSQKTWLFTILKKWRFKQAQVPQRNRASAAHMERARPSSPLLLWLHLCVWSNPKPATNVHQGQRTLRWIGHSRSFKVILINWCRQKSRMECCRNVQLMPTLFLKLRKIWQRENGKFVDFNDSTKVWRRPSKKRLRISTNDLYCQKLVLLTYIFAADSVGLYSLFVT